MGLHDVPDNRTGSAACSARNCLPIIFSRAVGFESVTQPEGAGLSSSVHLLPSQTIEPGPDERILGVTHLEGQVSFRAEDLEHRTRRIGDAGLEPADPLDSDRAPGGGSDQDVLAGELDLERQCRSSLP